MTDMTVANTILQQLGGSQFKMMTGSKNFVGSADMLMFSIGSGAKKKINKVRITLNAFDTYDIEFMKYSPSKLTCDVVEKSEGVYVEKLRDVFTAATGFFCTMR